MKKIAGILAVMLILASCSAPITEPETKETTSANVETPAEVTREVGNRIGNLFPEFSFQGLDGKVYSTADFKGKPTLVTFWTST